MLGDIKTFKKTINRGAVIRNHHDTPNNRVAAPCHKISKNCTQDKDEK